MRGSARAAIFILVLTAIPAAAGETRVPWRSLGFGDFQADPPPREQRLREDGLVRATVLPAIERNIAYRIAADGGIDVTAMTFAALFDPKRAWADRLGLDPKAEAALLRHEQGHLDITEGIVRQMTARTQEIRRQITAAFATDPALRGAMAALSGQIGAAGPESSRRELAARRVALLEEASPILTGLFALHTELQDSYDAETRHGRDSARQAEWEEAIRARLLRHPPGPRPD